MRKTQLSAFIVAALVLAACEPTPPSAPPRDAQESQICAGEDRTCQFSGSWELNLNDEFFFICDGSVSITDHLNGITFEGTWFIDDSGDCSAGSPITGEVQAGRIRADGGLNFFMEVPPPEGLVKDEDDIWEDIFAGAGVLDPTIFAGCTISDADNQMNGALTGSRMAVSASAALSCEDEIIFVGDNVLVVEALVPIQVRFEGNR